MKMKTLGVILLLFGVTAKAQGVKKEIIEVKSQVNMTEYIHEDGSQSTGGYGVGYHWRYKGEEQWNSVGRHGKHLAPVLKQFETSGRSYRKAKLLWAVGMPSGYVIATAGLGIATLGFLKPETIDDPNSPVPVKNKQRTALIAGGFITALGGCVLVTYSMLKGQNVFERSIEEYNSEAEKLKDQSYLKFGLGLTTLGMNNSPGLSVKLMF